MAKTPAGVRGQLEDTFDAGQTLGRAAVRKLDAERLDVSRRHRRRGVRRIGSDKTTSRRRKKLTRYLHLPAIVLIAGLSACGSSPPGDTPAGEQTPTGDQAPVHSEYRASGNEPFWDIVITDDSLQFALLGQDTLRAERPEAELRDGGWHFDATNRDRPFAIRIVEQRCNDTMSGRPFPHLVEVYAEGTTYAGCGGDTAVLLTDIHWRVVELNGAPVLAGESPTLNFAADGSLAGSGGCNQYRSTYEITGEGLRIGPPAATRMACADARANEQEQEYFMLLEQVDRFSVASDGSLVLHARDQPIIVAIR